MYMYGAMHMYEVCVQGQGGAMMQQMQQYSPVVPQKARTVPQVNARPAVISGYFLHPLVVVSFIIFTCDRKVCMWRQVRVMYREWWTCHDQGDDGVEMGRPCGISGQKELVRF